YRMKVANNCGGQATSTVATVTVNNVPTPPAPSATQNACGPQILHMDTGDLPTGVNWFWQGTNQTGESTQYNAANEDYQADQSGTYYVGAVSGGCWSYSSVLVTVNPLPPDPSLTAALEVSSNVCGPRIITSTTSPPGGVYWFWQGTNSNGVSVLYNAEDSYDVSTEGSDEYYMRALLGSNGRCSATSESIVVNVNLNLTQPPVPTPSSNECGPRTLTVTGPPPSGEQWYWQGTEENGTSTETEHDASLPYTVT